MMISKFWLKMSKMICSVSCDLIVAENLLDMNCDVSSTRRVSDLLSRVDECKLAGLCFVNIEEMNLNPPFSMKVRVNSRLAFSFG